MINTYKVADHIFSVDSIFDYVHEYLKDYRSELTPSFVIKIEKQDILNELQFNNNDKTLSPAWYEASAVYRKLMNKITKDGYLLFHGSCIAIDRKIGVLFAGISGAGKSTHASLYKKYLLDRCNYINDDKPILKIDDDSVIAYGTPWSGKSNLNTDEKIELKAIVFINKAKENHIEPLLASDALPNIFKQSYIPNNLVKECMEMLSNLIKNVKCYNLYCDISKEAFETSYREIEKL
ncbi:MAG: hypothetical protein MJ248_02885 [Bacilli bacterium]|nr:hypothetical protein [Bacilli bacterium]